LTVSLLTGLNLDFTHTQAKGYWHWFFLIQPSPQTENFILSSPEKFWELIAQRKTHMGGKIWSGEDIKEYQKHYFQPDAVHGVSAVDVLLNPPLLSRSTSIVWGRYCVMPLRTM